MAEIDLNPDMPGDIFFELIRREKAVAAKARVWMYEKYAYITISTTGKTQTALCPATMTIGTAPTGGHMNLYKNEGGVRKLRPTITSVKMVNEGGQDYTDSYLYEIEFDFKVFTLGDLDLVEESFFTVGAEVAFDFGWLGAPAKAGINQSAKKMLANVYNFSFSIEDDGGFKCNVKCMSPNGLWSKESMGGTEKVTDPADSGADKQASYLDALNSAFNTAFGLTDPDNGAKAASGGENKLAMKTGTVKAGTTTISGAPFWVAQVVSKHGALLFMPDTEDYFAYTNLDTLIKYVNGKLLAGESLFKYELATGASGKIHAVYEVGSADPTKVVLPGKYSVYGTAAFDWSALSAQGGTGADNISGIMLSLDYMNQVYLKLSGDSTSKKGGKKQPPKIQKFLQTIFDDIEQLTGGLVSMITLPKNINQGEAETSTAASPATIVIANRRSTVSTKTVTPYPFKVLSKRSITKSISLSTDFDADTLMLASKNAIGTGKSNYGKLKGLYGCNALETAEARSKTDDAGDDLTDADLKEAKLKYQTDGYTPESIASNSDLFRNYLSKLAATDNSVLAGSQFTEVIWMLKLSVTIDGIFGIPFLAPITVDRLPAIYRGNDKAYFSVTSVEHTFDGQGGWETSLDTVMRVQG